MTSSWFPPPAGGDWDAPLLAAVAAETVRRGGAALEWGVHAGNAGALEFYRRVGASDADVRIMSVDGERLRALAGAAIASYSRT